MPLNILNPQYPSWITSCLSEGAGVSLIADSGDFKGHFCPWAAVWEQPCGLSCACAAMALTA